MNQSSLLFLHSLSTVLISLYALILSFLRSLGVISRIYSSALILPPSDPGSLGDEAMVVGIVNYLRQRGLTNISLIAYYNVNEKYPVDSYEYLDLKDFFTNGISYRSLWKFIQFGYSVSQYERFYCLGADIMDGYYSDVRTLKRVKMVEMAAKVGLLSAILGFSYNSKPTQLSVKVLHDLPTQVSLYAREKVSYQRLIAKVPDHPVHLIADLAFLLSPAETSEKVARSLEWIQAQRNDKNQILGININSLLLKMLPEQTADTLVQTFVDSIVTVHEQNPSLSFMLLPHDSRQTQENLSDDILANKILEKLPTQLQSHCFKIPFPCQAAEVKAIVKHIDYVISSRMHLAIACLGQGIAVACITYQDKFAGLYQHFDLKPLTISPQELFEPNTSKLVDLIWNLIQQQSQLNEQIERKLPEVKKMVEIII